MTPRQKHAIDVDDDDRARLLIEQTIDRLKRWRRIATRFEKLAASYLAQATIAMIFEWL